MRRLPVWFRQDIPDQTTLKILQLFSEFGLNSVCRQAKCPNITECFKKKEVTFMILGASCTRNCGFCAVGPVRNIVQTNNNKIVSNGVDKSEGVLQPIDKDEPYRIAEVVKILGLSYVVITSVSRDDLDDGGSEQFAKTLELIYGLNKDIKIEVLIPDFQGKISSLKRVLDAGPTVASHNIETVRRLYGALRPQADYQLSLYILSKIKELASQVNTKSSMMLGLGETRQEVISTMEDLRNAACDILTLGQYLAPSVNNYPVKEFISIEQFQEYKDIGRGMGFKVVWSGPKVRSSYQAEEVQRELYLCTI